MSFDLWTRSKIKKCEFFFHIHSYKAVLEKHSFIHPRHWIFVVVFSEYDLIGICSPVLPFAEENANAKKATSMKSRSPRVLVEVGRDVSPPSCMCIVAPEPRRANRLVPRMRPTRRRWTAACGWICLCSCSPAPSRTATPPICHRPLHPRRRCPPTTIFLQSKNLVLVSCSYSRTIHEQIQ